MLRGVLISGAVVVVLSLALFVVLIAGLFLPRGMVDHRLDEYEGRKQRDVISVIGEMYERRQGGLGTRRVTAWRITSVEKCATRCPRPYAVDLDLYTLFGIPYGETGVSCGKSP